MRLLLVLLVAVSLNACQKPAANLADSSQDGAARIGTVIITQEDVANAAALLDEKDQAFAKTPIGRSNLVQILTREKLIWQDARANGLEQDKDYQQALAQKRAELDKIYEQFAQDTLVRNWYEKNSKKL